MSINFSKLKTYKKSEINALTKKLNSFRFGPSTENHAQWTRLFEFSESIGLEVSYSQVYGETLIFKTPKKITKEQSDFGKAWLKNFFFTSKGQPRRGKRTEGVSDHVLTVAKSVSRFEFIGVHVIASSYGFSINQAVPIYRAYNRKGECFDYSPIHWGQPIITEGV